MKTLAAVAMLLFQSPDAIQELEWDRMRAEGEKPVHHLVTVIASFQDGTPASKATIYCDGWWVKYVDAEPGDIVPGGYRFPFTADSRGAMGMNPGVNDEYISCHAEKDGMKGSNRLWFEQAKIPYILRITLDREME